MLRKSVAVSQVLRDRLALRGGVGGRSRHLLAQQRALHHQAAMHDGGALRCGAQDQEARLGEQPHAVRIVREVVGRKALRWWGDSVNSREPRPELGVLVGEQVAQRLSVHEGHARDEAH